MLAVAVQSAAVSLLIIIIIVAGVIECVTGLNQIRLLTLQDEIHRVLRDCPNLVSSVDPLFDNEGIFGKPFLGLETKHHQMQFYREYFHYVICH